jgi:hypothetical protein
MITLIQINKAVNNSIENALIDTEFSEVPIIAEDVSEPIVRPSLKIQIGNTKTGKFNKNNKERTLTVRVYFFAKDRYKYKIDNLKMQELIENAFLEDLKVTDTFFVPIVGDGVESEVVDTVLECSFDLYTVELLPETPGELMEDLELNTNLHEIKD